MQKTPVLFDGVCVGKIKVFLLKLSRKSLAMVCRILGSVMYWLTYCQFITICQTFQLFSWPMTSRVWFYTEPLPTWLYRYVMGDFKKKNLDQIVLLLPNNQTKNFTHNMEFAINIEKTGSNSNLARRTM